jgi:hypothetical protein
MRSTRSVNESFLIHLATIPRGAEIRVSTGNAAVPPGPAGHGVCCIQGIPSAREDEMVTMRRHACVALTIALFALTVAGCASTGAPATPVAVKDLSVLTGKWNGWIRTTGSGSRPATFEVMPTGDYTTRTEGFATQGTAQVKDGAVVLVGTSGSGRLGVSDRMSTASLAERANGVLVLRGSGRDIIGPFEFEFVKQK